MPSTSSGGPLTDFLKTAGFMSHVAAPAARVAGKSLELTGRGIWGAAGHLAPNPWARAGLLGVTALGVGTQVPQLAGRMAQDAQYVRGQAPSPRGF